MYDRQLNPDSEASSWRENATTKRTSSRRDDAHKILEVQYVKHR